MLPLPSEIKLKIIQEKLRELLHRKFKEDTALFIEEKLLISQLLESEAKSTAPQKMNNMELEDFETPDSTSDNIRTDCVVTEVQVDSNYDRRVQPGSRAQDNFMGYSELSTHDECSDTRLTNPDELSDGDDFFDILQKALSSDTQADVSRFPQHYDKRLKTEVETVQNAFTTLNFTESKLFDRGPLEEKYPVWDNFTHETKYDFNDTKLPPQMQEINYPQVGLPVEMRLVQDSPSFNQPCYFRSVHSTDAYQLPFSFSSLASSSINQAHAEEVIHDHDATPEYYSSFFHLSVPEDDLFAYFDQSAALQFPDL